MNIQNKKKCLWCGIVIFSIFVFGVLWNVNSNKKRMILPSSENLYFTFYVDDVIAATLPGKEDGYYFNIEKSNCTNGASIIWDRHTWSPKIANLTEAKTKCEFYFEEKYVEEILNGTDPLLDDPLIPVNISDTGVVTRADLSSEWYNYENKIWANAIILKDESSSDSYKVGSVISEDAIESYFVWIPRYRYQIFDEGTYTDFTTTGQKEQTINIVFENKTMVISSGSSLEEWLTHPAFTVFDVDGMWVGKFETGTTLTSDYNVRNGNAIQIKPNAKTWKNVLATAFYSCYDYKRQLESHMMKNTEWGAVAYLHQSVYGSGESLRINNNWSNLTGYAAVNEPTCGFTETNEECNIHEETEPGVDGTYTVNYYNPASVVASTTGNYSGIYDMSGGLWDAVMAVMMDQSGNPMSGNSETSNSGFNGLLADGNVKTNGYDWPEAKYYDLYAYGETIVNYERRILGDATGEMGPFGYDDYTSGSELTRGIASWYGDNNFYVDNKRPLFRRGSARRDGTGAGIFSFQSYPGDSNGFRVVLMIQD